MILPLAVLFIDLFPLVFQQPEFDFAQFVDCLTHVLPSDNAVILPDLRSRVVKVLYAVLPVSQPHHPAVAPLDFIEFFLPLVQTWDQVVDSSQVQALEAFVVQIELLWTLIDEGNEDLIDVRSAPSRPTSS